MNQLSACRRNFLTSLFGTFGLTRVSARTGSNRLQSFVVLGLLIVLGMYSPRASADNVYASIRGTVTDSTGALLPGVKVTATNSDTRVATTVTSDSKGYYNFQQLQVGPYKVTASLSGFKGYSTTDIPLVVNQIYQLNVPMSVGGTDQTVEVKADTVQVETSDTQMKTVINGAQIVDAPLIGRNWTALEQLAPGVQASSDRFGTYSVSGSQSNQSSYLLNGQDSNDLPLNTAGIVPSPDAISEFNLITNTINAEYGRNSGAIVNALIKSGTNGIHGDGFEFYRDTFLNSKNYFQPAQVFHQNTYGGTLGGPVWKDHTFFFASYQGRRARAPQTTSVQTVYSAAERGGDFSTDGALSTNTIPFALQGETGPCGPGTANTTYDTCFPTGHISPANFNSISQALVTKYVPLPNTVSNGFTFNPVQKQKQDQGILRLDHNFNQNNTIWFYGYLESAPTIRDLPFTGSTLPGFGDQNLAHNKQFVASYTHIFSSTALNEFRVGYTRFNLALVTPQTVVLPASLGFTGITPQFAGGAGAPRLDIGGSAGQSFSLGFSSNGPQPRKDQTYQATDNFSKLIGTHNLKFGIDGRKFQVDNPFYGNNNGQFQFQGGGTYTTGIGGLDFLLGIPDSYNQASGGRIDAKAYETYSYAQDTWKASDALTLNYGIGWQIDTPLNNNQNKGLGINCVDLGAQQSKIFPTAPAGLLFPGDRGCTKSGYTINYKDVGPRFGFAYSPDFGRLSGGNAHKASIRGAFGVFYNRTEEEGALQNLGAVPFSLTSTGAGDAGGSPSFASPYNDIAGTPGSSLANKFPFVPPAAGSVIDFTQYNPLSLNTISPKLQAPYAMNFNLNVQRELPSKTIMTVAYVGSLGRHLLRTYEANPITLAGQAACAADPKCVRNRINQHNLYPTHSVLPGNVFASDGQQVTDGTSNYNSAQVSFNKQATHGFQGTVAYTYSHALDNGSGLEDTGFGNRGINPYPQFAYLNYGDSGFDARHRLVVSYDYELKLPGGWKPIAKTLLGGFHIFGITTVATGFPVTLSQTGDYHSLTCDQFSYYACPDNPNVLNYSIKHLDPRHSAGTTLSGKARTNYYFAPQSFSKEATGQLFGNSKRNFFHGPGINNTDLTLAKDFTIRERYRTELRLEAYNAFNHTQFNLPNGNISSVNFGRITSAGPGRLIQLGGKFYF